MRLTRLPSQKALPNYLAYSEWTFKEFKQFISILDISMVTNFYDDKLLQYYWEPVDPC